MSKRTSRFGEALQRAADQALKTETRDLPEAEKAALLRELLDFYRKHQATIDRAVDGALKLSESAQGRAQIDRLAGSLQQGIERVDGEAGRALLGGAALQPTVDAALAEGILAVSVGVSLGLTLLIGAAAGADVLINVDNNNVYVRGFGIADVGLDAFLGIGLNIGIWQELPVIDDKSYIGGLALDVPMLPAVIRVMAVREGPGMWSSPSDFTLKGLTFAINYGLGAGVMVYRGAQYMIGVPPKRASLTVCNCTDGSNPCKPGTSSIAQNVSSTLDCTLENTSGRTITIAPGNQMTLTLPSCFASSDLDAIKVTPPSNWTLGGWTGNALTLTYNGTSTLDWTGSLQVALANARPSQPDPIDGQVVVRIPDAVVQGGTFDQPGIIARATLTLVPSIKYATISTWAATYPDFTIEPGYPNAGVNVTAVSMETKNDVCMLTKATDSNGKLWYLGYQFYIDDTTKDPYFRACWYEEGTFVKYGTTLFAPNFMVLTSSAQDSTAYFGNVQGNKNTMQITVTLDS